MLISSILWTMAVASLTVGRLLRTAASERFRDDAETGILKIYLGLDSMPHSGYIKRSLNGACNLHDRLIGKRNPIVVVGGFSLVIAFTWTCLLWVYLTNSLNLMEFFEAGNLNATLLIAGAVAGAVFAVDYIVVVRLAKMGSRGSGWSSKPAPICGALLILAAFSWSVGSALYDSLALSGPLIRSGSFSAFLISPDWIWQRWTTVVADPINGGNQLTYLATGQSFNSSVVGLPASLASFTLLLLSGTAAFVDRFGSALRKQLLGTTIAFDRVRVKTFQLIPVRNLFFATFGSTLVLFVLSGLAAFLGL